MLFKLLAGKHYDKQTDKLFCSGEMVESKLRLDQMFPNKFERVIEDAPPVILPPEEPEPIRTVLPPVESEVQETENTETTTTEEVENPLGTDVTDLFKDAAGSGVLVFRSPAGEYSVSLEKEPQIALNKKVLKTKKAVVEFIDAVKE